MRFQNAPKERVVRINLDTFPRVRSQSFFLFYGFNNASDGGASEAKEQNSLCGLEVPVSRTGLEDGDGGLAGNLARPSREHGHTF